MPVRGLWSADLVVDADAADAVTGKVTIVAGASTFVGTALRPGADPGGQVKVRVLGGAGRLLETIEPASYVAPTVREVVEAILLPLGERLSSKSDSAILGRSLAKWSRTKDEAASCLNALTKAIGSTWRVLDDGSVWVGSDSFETLTGDFSITAQKPEQGMVEAEDDSFILRPGRTALGHKVYAVEFVVGAKETRANLTTVEGGSPRQRADAAAWKRQAAEAGFDFTRTYQGRVTSQNGDQTVEVKVSTKSPLASLSKVPLRHGIPGVTELRLAPGAEVSIGFDDGDPQKPYAALPLRGGRLLHLVVDGDSFELGGTEPVAMATPTEEWASAVNDALTAIAGLLNTPGTVTGAPGTVIPPGTLAAASSKLKSKK